MNDTACCYLLDTNIVADRVRNPAGRAAQVLVRVGSDAVCTRIVVACELRFGVARRASARQKRQVDAVLSVLPVLSLEPPVEIHYGETRATLTAQGPLIGGNDMLIAAHARALGLILMTDHRREFDRVPGLAFENWL